MIGLGVQPVRAAAHVPQPTEEYPAAARGCPEFRGYLHPRPYQGSPPGNRTARHPMSSSRSKLDLQHVSEVVIDHQLRVIDFGPPA